MSVSVRRQDIVTLCHRGRSWDSLAFFRFTITNTLGSISVIISVIYWKRHQTKPLHTYSKHTALKRFSSLVNSVPVNLHYTILACRKICAVFEQLWPTIVNCSFSLVSASKMLILLFWKLVPVYLFKEKPTQYSKLWASEFVRPHSNILNLFLSVQLIKEGASFGRFLKTQRPGWITFSTIYGGKRKRCMAFPVIGKSCHICLLKRRNLSGKKKRSGSSLKPHKYSQIHRNPKPGFSTL